MEESIKIDCKSAFQVHFGDLKCADRTLYRRKLAGLVQFKKILYYIDVGIQHFSGFVESKQYSKKD